MPWEDLLSHGRIAADHPRPAVTDIAVIQYTSGTTGRPKGAVLSYDNLVWAAEAGAAFDGLKAGDELLSYLPMAWVGDHIFSYAQGYVVGLVVNCPESASTVMTDLREIGPTYYFAPPRVLENLITQVTIRMEDAGLLKRRLFQFFMGVARRVGPALLDGRSVSIGADRRRREVGGGMTTRPGPGFHATLSAFTSTPCARVKTTGFSRRPVSRSKKAMA